MIIIKDVKHLKQCIRFHQHESKKIGKLDINYNKILSTKFYLHEGHLKCIKTLKENGADYIMLECINSINCFKAAHEKNSNKMLGYFDYKNKIIDDVKLEEYCKSLGIDYLFYNSQDYKHIIDDKIIKLVDKIIKNENYKEILQIPDDEFKLLRVNLIVRTYRNTNNIIYVKSNKDGSWVYALKHYMEKYLKNKMIIINPIMRMDFYHPVSSGLNNILNENVKIFLEYFYTIPNKEFLENFDFIIKSIKQCAINLDINIDIRYLLNVNYISMNDNIFISIGVGTKSNLYKINKLITNGEKL